MMRGVLRGSFARSFSTARVCLQEARSVELGKLSTGESEAQIERVSGAPAELSTNRIVRIFRESKPATQSGTHGTTVWRLDWDIVPRANKWENDLMGWASSGDYMQGTQMRFRSKEDAIAFASNQGWDYYTQEPHKRAFRPKQYAMNFEHSPGKLKHIRTK
ncbi:hypothetical protein TRVA0_018S00826 [Trichomonascus vanleenenianus]|uniref:ETC complex I subunit n=1 Tax=Trichomonascus vanleenenianus TaxID=2268995 RepID=UPI003EC9565D